VYLRSLGVDFAGPMPRINATAHAAYAGYYDAAALVARVHAEDIAGYGYSF
jgi:hypothetical protein